MGVAVTQVSSRVYRDVIGQFATGVAVLTTRTDEGPFGMTVNSLTSVSLKPTLLLVCLAREARTTTAICESGLFVVNLLDYRQRDLSNGFASAGSSHFAEIDYATTSEGVPVLLNTLAYLRCRMWQSYDGGDHEIVVGEVVECRRQTGGDPLIFYGGSYARQISDEDYPEPNWWG